MTARVKMLLLCAGCAATSGLGCTTSDVDPMERQPKFKTYQESSLFNDGRTMRMPPAGAIPRERAIGDPMLIHGKIDVDAGGTIAPTPITVMITPPLAEPTDAGASLAVDSAVAPGESVDDFGRADGGPAVPRATVVVVVPPSAPPTSQASPGTPPTYAKEIPIPVTKDLLLLGKKRFDITCATCHGILGDGVSVVARKMLLKPPPSLHDYRDRPPGYIFDVITSGYGLMASYAWELPLTERWAVVAYVKALQLSQHAPVGQLSDADRQHLQGTP